jgi:sodium-dependent dicarboxylate transporter 2/3/5
MDRKYIFALLSILVGFFVYLIPIDVTTEAHTLLAILITTVLFWLFEILPLGITALLASASTVVFGVSSVKEAFQNFSHYIIFLFLGSFLLAEAFSSYSLDKEIALRVLSLSWVRKNENLFLLMVLVIPWFLSMWLSNTATTAMMLPIAAGFLSVLYPDGSWINNRAKFLLLGIAYASSIGGIATLVGTPPNLIALGFLEKEGISISFGEWIFKILPISIVTLLFLFFLLKKTLGGVKIQELTLSEKPQKLNGTQKVILAVFTTVVFLWLLPSLLGILKGFIPSLKELYLFTKHHLHYAVVAVLGAGTLFLLRNEKGEPILDKEHVKRIDWDTILLFGGGLTLGSLMFKTGLVNYVGQKLATILPSNEFLTLLVLVLVAIFLTEFSSNTATANVLIPVVIGLSHQLGFDTERLVIATTLACSYAFMLPMATPPNAIVFGFANFKISEMAKLGVILNIVGTFVIAIFVYLLF